MTNLSDHSYYSFGRCTKTRPVNNVTALCTQLYQLSTQKSEFLHPSYRLTSNNSFLTYQVFQVKCDRQRPCSLCERAGIQCVYPPGPGRAPKQPKRGVDTRLLDRLSRLEGIVKRLEHRRVEGDQESLPQLPSQRADDAIEESDNKNHALAQPSFGSGNRPLSSASSGQFGRLLIDETESFYINNVLLTSLLDEVRFRFAFQELKCAGCINNTSRLRECVI